MKIPTTLVMCNLNMEGDPTIPPAKVAVRKGSDLRLITERYGIVMSWFTNREAHNTTDTKDLIETAYGYPMYWEASGKLDKELRFSYPGDPTLKPNIVFFHAANTFIVYDHDLCALLKVDGSFEWSRID